MEKDGASSEKGGNENNTISEQEREYAQVALTEFNRGNYASCLQTLNKLESLRPNDIKVLHNKAVAEYYKSDLKKTDHFRKSLNLICSQVRS